MSSTPSDDQTQQALTQALRAMLRPLPDDAQRHAVAGKAVWVTPPRCPGNRVQGVSVGFPSDEKSRALKARIEEILGAAVQSIEPTQTL